MALGTFAAAVRSSHDNIPTFVDRISFVGDSSYPTGGYTNFEASVRTVLARGNVDVIAAIGQGCGGYDISYDRTNDKLMVWRNGAINTPHAEVPGATDLSAVTFNAVILSR